MKHSPSPRRMKIKNFLIQALPSVITIGVVIWMVFLVLYQYNNSLVVTDCINCNPNVLETFKNPWLRIHTALGFLVFLWLIITAIQVAMQNKRKVKKQ
jgi:succinate dehydrogenase hydrophobic anchor subunit